MLKSGQQYYCETNQDVNLLMNLLEQKEYKWSSGRALRSQYQMAPIIYYIEEDRRIHCSSTPRVLEVAKSIHVKDIRNKIISELRR